MYIASTSLLIALTFQRASNADLFSDLSISVTLKLKIWPRIQPGRSAKGQLLGYTGPIVAAELPRINAHGIRDDREWRQAVLRGGWVSAMTY